jgi:ribosomal protein S20
LRLKGERVRRLMRTALGVGLLCGLSGCRHKTQLAPLPAIQTQVDLLDIPEPDNLPLLEPTPVNTLPEPTAAAATRLKRERKKPVKMAPPTVSTVPTAPAVPAASVEPSPEVTAIGALTAGGETNPQAKQEAEDLIASIEKRLNAFTAQTTDDQKAQISKVRNFWRDAQAALKSGDAEGAKTLATKAKLLLDDLEK